ncbi:MAG: hypothetical protein ACRDVP_01520 [Acidimicrobiales bacterium]
MIVLILVAILWIAVLAPTVISKVLDRRSAGSIGRFHDSLDVLERTGPKIVQPAFRLVGDQCDQAGEVPSVVPLSPPPVRPNLVLLRGAGPQVAEPDLGDASARPFASELPVKSAAVEPGPRVTQKAGTARRRPARRRRRDVFASLCAVAAVGGLLGIARPLRGAWIVSAFCLAMLVVFVGVCAYIQAVQSGRRDSHGARTHPTMPYRIQPVHAEEQEGYDQMPSSYPEEEVSRLARAH